MDGKKKYVYTRVPPAGTFDGFMQHFFNGAKLKAHIDLYNILILKCVYYFFMHSEH